MANTTSLAGFLGYLRNEGICEEKATIVLRKKTSDNKSVVLWSDGSVTGAMGIKISGVPTTKNMSVGRAFMGDVELFGSGELSALYKAAKRGGSPQEIRSYASNLLRPKAFKLKPTWEITSTDNKGKATERVWKLNRIQWPGLAVIDHVNRGSRRGGRLEVFRGDSSGTYTTTHMAFKNLSELTEYLMSIRSA